MAQCKAQTAAGIQCTYQAAPPPGACGGVTRTPWRAESVRLVRFVLPERGSYRAYERMVRR